MKMNILVQRGCYIPRRYCIVFLTLTGFLNFTLLRDGLSISLVTMVNSTYSNVQLVIDPTCPGNGNETSSRREGEFEWSQKEQGLVLSSFYYGNIITQIPGGILSTKYGGKWVLGLSIFGAALLTLTTPIAAWVGGVYILCFNRFLIGIAMGFAAPAAHSILGKWCPSNEKARMVGITYSGLDIGSIIALTVGSILSNSSVLGGWPSAFYVFGAFGLVWFIVWSVGSSDSPETHLTISNEEMVYIASPQGETVEQLQSCPTIPWWQILTSIPVIAVTVASFSSSWVLYLILTDLPSYYRQVMNFNLMENGFMSALPVVSGVCVYIGSGVIAEKVFLQWFTVVTIRRIFVLFGSYISAIALIVVGFSGCGQSHWAVTCMVTCYGLSVLVKSTSNTSQIDLSPRFTGVLMAISNSFGNLAGSITPAVTGYFTNMDPSRDNFQKVFQIAAIISALGGSVFCLCISGEQQDWNDQSNKKIGKYQYKPIKDISDDND